MNCCGGGGESRVSYPSMMPDRSCHPGKSCRCTPARRLTPLLPPSHTAVAAQAAPPPPLPCTTFRPNLRPSCFRSLLWGGGRCGSGFAAEMHEAARADRDVVPSTPLHPPTLSLRPRMLPRTHQRRRGYTHGTRPWNSARANSCSKAGAARALSSVESVETARPARRLIDREAPEPNIAPRRRLGPSRRRPAAQRSSKGGAAAAA